MGKCVNARLQVIKFVRQAGQGRAALGLVFDLFDGIGIFAQELRQESRKLLPALPRFGR